MRNLTGSMPCVMLLILPGFVTAILPAYSLIKSTAVINPQTASPSGVLDGVPPGNKALVVVLPQLGEFDSTEFCEQLVAVETDLAAAHISLCVVGIGDTKCAECFSKFTGLSMEYLRVDPDGSIHRKLELNAGPGLKFPSFFNDNMLSFLLSTLPGGPPADSSLLRSAADAWLNYLAMCAGLGAPGTLQEIFRGYIGDYSAPERLAIDAVVKAGPITIGPGVGAVEIGPLKYNQWFADERGYQRPVELATVRLRGMVEVLTKWDTYVTNPLTIAQRGATYLFDETGEVLYAYKHKGVLTYSETMPRPLSFLGPYIGDARARNPLGLYDTDQIQAPGRGILKPIGKVMGLLKPIFCLQNKLQADFLGVKYADRSVFRAEIEATISENGVVIYAYSLSPFSTDAVALLKKMGAKCEIVTLGLEWFLLGKEASAKRTVLLEMTGQSSLPHVFIGGKHVGGMFSGSPTSNLPGLAGLKEQGLLSEMLKESGAI